MMYGTYNQLMWADQQRPIMNLRGLGGDTFNAAEVAGKTLIAKVNIPVKSNSLDNGKVLYTVKPGETVGVVSGYTQPKTGQSVLNWQVDVAKTATNPGGFGYVAHGIGKFDVSSLVVQGATSTEQKHKDEQAQKEKDENPALYYFKKIGIPVLLIGGGIFIVAKLGAAVIEKKL